MGREGSVGVRDYVFTPIRAFRVTSALFRKYHVSSLRTELVGGRQSARARFGGVSVLMPIVPKSKQVRPPARASSTSKEKSSTASTDEPLDGIPPLPDSMPAAMPIVINQSEQKMLMCIALWMPHYGGLFAAELEHNRRLTGTVGMVGSTGNRLHPGSA